MPAFLNGISWKTVAAAVVVMFVLLMVIGRR
jgi:hypothetical protein